MARDPSAASFYYHAESVADMLDLVANSLPHFGRPYEEAIAI
jgi:hypothetical protein